MRDGFNSKDAGFIYGKQNCKFRDFLVKDFLKSGTEQIGANFGHKLADKSFRLEWLNAIMAPSCSFTCIHKNMKVWDTNSGWK